MSCNKYNGDSDRNCTNYKYSIDEDYSWGRNNQEHRLSKRDRTFEKDWEDYEKFCEKKCGEGQSNRSAFPCSTDVAHIGLRGATMLIGGPVATIPMDKFFAKNGSNICGTKPVKIKGCHTYLVEWSGGVDPIDMIASARIEILVDGYPVQGSANTVDVTSKTEGIVALSGGAVIIAPYDNCYHTLELQLTTGINGAEISNINMRIIQLY